MKSTISNTPTQAGYHSQFGDEVIVFDTSEVLREDICDHFICWDILNFYMLFFDMEMDEVMSNVNVLGSVAVPCTARE